MLNEFRFLHDCLCINLLVFCIRICFNHNSPFYYWTFFCQYHRHCNRAISWSHMYLVKKRNLRERILLCPGKVGNNLLKRNMEKIQIDRDEREIEFKTMHAWETGREVEVGKGEIKEAWICCEPGRKNRKKRGGWGVIGKEKCTVGQNQVTSSVGEWANEWVQAERAMRSKQMSERWVRTGERTSEWLSTCVPILSCF